MKTVRTLSGGIWVRYNAADPDDLAYLVSSGIVWRAGPKAKQAAVLALIEGRLPMPANLPDEVRAFVESKR